MKRILFILIVYHISFIASFAQTPSWAKKAAQGVFTLKTFTADGQLIGSSNGFFINEQGDAVSTFTPFKNAYRAIVIDAQGKEWPVETIIGANDMYDVAKFQVAAKNPTALTIATTSATKGATLWLLPYAAKKNPVCEQGMVEEAEQFQNSYSYYTLNMQTSEQQVGCPILNDAGEVLGMMQPAAGGQSEKAYAVSATFVADMKANGLSFNDGTLRQTRIAKALPEKYDEAMLALYMAAGAMNTEDYSDYINRFIGKFPNMPDGYIYRARVAVSNNEFTRRNCCRATSPTNFGVWIVHWRSLKQHTLPIPSPSIANNRLRYCLHSRSTMRLATSI